jgi:hypothetical protein
MDGKINSLKYAFESTNKNKPAVKISFSGEGFEYKIDGYAAKISAQYTELPAGYVLSDAEYESYFGNGLSGFKDSNYGTVVVKCTKKIEKEETSLDFLFYENAKLSYSFAHANCNVYNTANMTSEQTYSASILSSSGGSNLGVFVFNSAAITGDVLYDLNSGESITFTYVNRRKDYYALKTNGTNNDVYDDKGADYSDYFTGSLLGFQCPGYENIYVTCTKTINVADKEHITFVFNFYTSSSRLNKDLFATASCNYTTSLTEINTYEAYMYGAVDNEFLGIFTFNSAAITGDILYDLKSGGVLKFSYSNAIEDWKDATLLYKDPADALKDDEFLNYYPVSSKGTISNAINYWDFPVDFANYFGKDKLQHGYFCLRIKLVDTNNDETIYYSTIINQTNGKYGVNELACFTPVFYYDVTGEFNSNYCDDENPFFSLVVPTSGNDYESLSSLMDKCYFYRYAETLDTLKYQKWNTFIINNGKTVFEFHGSFVGEGGMNVGSVIDGLKKIVLQISDGCGNSSEFIVYDNANKYENPVYTLDLETSSIDFKLCYNYELSEEYKIDEERDNPDNGIFNYNQVFESGEITDEIFGEGINKVYLYRGISAWYIGAIVGDEENAIASGKVIGGDFKYLDEEKQESIKLSVLPTKYLWKKDCVRSINLYRQKPNSIVFNLKGSSGSEYYTGFYKSKDGHFIPSNKIEVTISAKENKGLPLEYKVFIGDAEKETNWKKYVTEGQSSSIIEPFYLTSESDAGIFENNYSVELNLVFRSAAGNKTDLVTKSIYYNTVLLQTSKTNLRDSSNTYNPVVRYFNGDDYITINEKEGYDLETPIRSWKEIFYPVTHGFPLNQNGNIDIEKALQIESGDLNYDPVKTEEYTEEVTTSGEDGKDKTETKTMKRLVYDEEKRPLTLWTNFGTTKMYPTLVSNNKIYNSETGETTGLEYWIIDSTGYTDFYLEFEHFHLNSEHYEPVNNLSPFKGDCLVVYDASAKGATEEYIDETGNTAYKLLDSSKLTMLAAYTGDGIDAVQLYPEEKSLNATGDGAFTTEKFTSTSRICLIFYSDNYGDGTGFKIKASPSRETNWLNWELDNKRGELWLHKIDKQQLEGTDLYVPSNNAGYCPEQVDMSYEYSGTAFDINYRDGSIRFYEKPFGQVWGTFCHYGYTAEEGCYIWDKKEQKNVPVTYTYALTNDDVVDYREVSIFVETEEGEINKNNDKSNHYNYELENSGKIISGIETYKDSGLIKFVEGKNPPKKIMYSDYYCHTYYRLTDDGYGDLKFYDSVLVPEKSDIYPYYTYVDLKVTNEGSADLSSGRLNFTLRGISTNNTITSVLNPDRPWDVQQGTAEETIDLVGGVARANFDFPPVTFDNMIAIAKGNQITVGDGEDKKTYEAQNKEIDFANATPEGLKPKQNIYIRVVWSLVTDGSSDKPEFVVVSAGEKVFSSEIEGTFYSIEV